MSAFGPAASHRLVGMTDTKPPPGLQDRIAAALRRTKEAEMNATDKPPPVSVFFRVDVVDGVPVGVVLRGHGIDLARIDEAAEDLSALAEWAATVRR
jgi:hypothetical protein